MSDSTDCRIEVIIDGDSVAHDGMQTPSTAHLRCASYWLRDNRDVVKGTIVIGPKLRHEISCSWDLDDMVNKGYVKQCPAGYKADTFILEFARLHPRAFII
ncbi:MAG: hypothetical protein GYA24_05595, partial [Candidatus Lokiarchaeota archaeon]|nr:hypothetical protein [Candidatus Lokiarchaeota archaeon]